MRRFLKGKSLKELIPTEGMEFREFLPIGILIAKEVREIAFRL